MEDAHAFDLFIGEDEDADLSGWWQKGTDAALVDVGIAPTIVRAFVLIARTAGLVAHLAEEMRAPIGKPLWLETERRASNHG